MTGARYLARFLNEKGVGQVFDYPGNSLLSIYPALREAGIAHRTARSESGAIFAASGVSRSGAGIGVCFATSGPGATNLVTGLADAMLDSVPLIAFTGQVSTSVIGQDAFQEADLLGITLPITKHNFLVKDGAALPTVLEEAWRIAQSGRPGPVLVDLPQNVLSSEIPEGAASPRLPHKRDPGNLAFDKQKDAFFDLLSRAKRPLLLVGGGCKSASASVRNAVSKLNLPAVCTLMGKGVLSDNDRACYGLVGIHGNGTANELLRSCDTLLAVGCRFSDRTIPNVDLLRGKCVLHVDTDAAELNKRVLCALGAAASAEEFFTELSAAPLAPFAPSWAPEKENSPAGAPDFCLKRALNDLANAFPDAIFVTDVGTHQVLAANAIRSDSPYDFLSSGGLGAMGFGLGAAIGAALSRPDRRVVLITGEGGLQMNLGELASIREFSLQNLSIVLCDNHALGLVEELNRLQKHPAICQNRQDPDFDKLFSAFSIVCARAKDAKTFSCALSDLARGKAQALHLILSPDESAYPQNAPEERL